MARRGRHRRVGLQRIDAAIDALTPMGFSSELIRKKVDQLLKEYGGEDGWPFIEDSAYKVLLECILDESEDLAIEEGEHSCRDLPIEDGRKDGVEEEPSKAGPSGDDAIDPTASETATNDTPLRCPVSIALHNPTSSPAVHVPSPSMIPTSNAENWTNDILIDQKKIAAYNSIYMFPAPPGFEHICHENIAPGKRKPCLGWIGPMDDEDFVLLEPAPFLSWRTGERRGKRKSRWDVSPDDVE